MQAEDIFQSKSTGKALSSTNILLSFLSARENLQSVQEDSWTLPIYRWEFTIQNMIIFDTLHIPPRQQEKLQDATMKKMFLCWACEQNFKT